MREFGPLAYSLIGLAFAGGALLGAPVVHRLSHLPPPPATSLWLIGSGLLGVLVFLVAHFRRKVDLRDAITDTVVNNIGAGMVAIDARRTVVAASTLATQAFGIRVGVPLGDVAKQYALKRPDGSVASLEEWPIVRALAGEAVRNESYLSQQGDANLDLLISASPVKDRNGTVILAVASYRDITELRELDRLKDEFIGIASHELREPLAVIRALAQLGTSQAAKVDPAKARKAVDDLSGYLAQIVTHVDGMTDLISQMLNVSRIDTGRLVLRSAYVRLTSVARKAVDSIWASDKSHPLTVDVSGVGQPERLVLADAEWISQVIANLLKNALKYSPEGSEVTIGVRDVAAGLEVWVKDEGMGVPDPEREAIFTKFYRSKKAIASDASGLGLGLYISRKILELHGGRIWLDPANATGSTFRFFLPAEPGQVKATEAADSPKTVLGLLLEATSPAGYLNEVLDLILEWSGCRCAGIRVLQRDGSVPYEVYQGFSQEFWQSENFLCLKSDNCACTRVISGTAEAQDLPLMKGTGSFCTPDVQAFAQSLSQQERKRFRGRCIDDGFRTIVIVPLRHGGTTVGAVHLADERSGLVTPEMLADLEAVAPLIAEVYGGLLPRDQHHTRETQEDADRVG